MKKRIPFIIMVILLLAVTTFTFAALAEDAAGEAVSVFPAGSPDEVAAVILHTNDIHAGYADYIGYDGLVLYKKRNWNRYTETSCSWMPATPCRETPSPPFQKARRSSG